MQKTGTIVQVTPTQRGGYNSQNGYIYTFDMTIDCPDGQFTGEIGSKSQSYPKGNGQEITVFMSQGDYGPRFKAVNPQYAGEQGGQQRPPQGNGPPNKGRDYDKENRGKCRFGFYQACIGRGCNPVEMVKDKAMIDAIEILIGWSMSGPRPAPQPATGGGPNPDYVGDEPPPPVDEDIPY